MSCCPRTRSCRWPPNLSFEEAATLPCAGVTAWNGLAEGACPLHPGQDVLLLGTGGVSILALQIAAAGGANIVITSSSDEKLERARALGAKAVINYGTVEEWGQAAAGAFGRPGVDKVIEVGGFGTLPKSMQAVGWGGEIAMIGVLTRGGDTTPHILMLKGASLRGIMVGSKAMAISLNRAIEAADIHPVIDRVFPFEEAAEAYRYQASPELFGKVVIRSSSLRRFASRPPRSPREGTPRRSMPNECRSDLRSVSWSPAFAGN